MAAGEQDPFHLTLGLRRQSSARYRVTALARCGADTTVFHTLLVGLDFFSIETAGPADVVNFLQTSADTLELGLMSAMVDDLLLVPMMLLITSAALHGKTALSPSRDVAVGFVWASLPLRPLWWAAMIVMVPTMSALSIPSREPATLASTVVGYQMIHTVLNTATEDIAFNLLGGSWFVIIEYVMTMCPVSSRILGIIGMVIGACYLLSSAELSGLTMGGSGKVIPLIASVAGPFWLSVADIFAARKITSCICLLRPDRAAAVHTWPRCYFL